jgi:hypothetical protein
MAAGHLSGLGLWLGFEELHHAANHVYRAPGPVHVSGGYPAAHAVTSRPNGYGRRARGCDGLSCVGCAVQGPPGTKPSVAIGAYTECELCTACDPNQLVTHFDGTLNWDSAKYARCELCTGCTHDISKINLANAMFDRTLTMMSGNTGAPTPRAALRHDPPRGGATLSVVPPGRPSPVPTRVCLQPMPVRVPCSRLQAHQRSSRLSKRPNPLTERHDRRRWHSMISRGGRHDDAGASIYTTPAPEVPHGLAVIKVHGVRSDMVSESRVHAMMKHYPNKRHYKVGEVEMMKVMMNVSDECGFPSVRPCRPRSGPPHRRSPFPTRVPAAHNTALHPPVLLCRPQ